MQPVAVVDGDRELLQHIGATNDATIESLCDAMGVTPTAVRQRLNRLQDMQLISRTPLRAGRGRPRHFYVLSEAGRGVLGDNYAELAVLLWEELQHIEDVQLRESIRNRLRSRFVERLSGPAGGESSISQRMQNLSGKLSERGFRAEVGVDDAGLSVLREHQCPYYELASKDAGICDLELEVFQEVLGVPLELVHRCRDGASCCEFRLAESSTGVG